MSKVSIDEVLDTIEIISEQKLNIRAVTLGVNVMGCASRSVEDVERCLRERLAPLASRFVEAAEEVEKRYGVPIKNKRITVSPVYLLLEPLGGSASAGVRVARALDEICEDSGIDLLGGYTALAPRGMSSGARALVESIPEAISSTRHVCASVEVGNTRSGINVDAANLSAMAVSRLAQVSSDPAAPARVVALANAPPDVPFMAGGFHGTEGPDRVINVAISGPGVVAKAVREHSGGPVEELYEEIKRASFKISRAGQLIGKAIAGELGVSMGSVDLSLAPAPEEGESVANIIEGMGVERTGLPGSVFALALLTDAIKRGGAAGVEFVGGFSGAFIPVSEDLGMSDAARRGFVNIHTLMAMSSVCSTGVDMVAIPGDTPWEAISGLILDEAAIGVMNGKSTGVRVIPVKGGRPGDEVELGGLFGRAVVVDIRSGDVSGLVKRGGRSPAPVHANRN